MRIEVQPDDLAAASSDAALSASDLLDLAGSLDATLTALSGSIGNSTSAAGVAELRAALLNNILALAQQSGDLGGALADASTVYSEADQSVVQGLGQTG